MKVILEISGCISEEGHFSYFVSFTGGRGVSQDKTPPRTNPKEVKSLGGLDTFVPGSKLPLFPHNRGKTHQPNSRGLYTHHKDSYWRWDEFNPQYKEWIDPGTFGNSWLSVHRLFFSIGLVITQQLPKQKLPRFGQPKIFRKPMGFVSGAFYRHRRVEVLGRWTWICCFWWFLRIVPW